ncbi:MAG TPA: hypothetical protein ENN03_09605 [bacterium]|nr:hypothetical protein [bacterium]
MTPRSSKRKKRGLEEMATNITPMMNLMVVLIPLLLTSAEFVKLSVIELNLPPVERGSEGEMLSQLPEENMKTLDLTVTITDKGFFISSAMAVLAGEQAEEPTIPLIRNADGIFEHDYETLSIKLYEIKQRALGRFPDAEQIIILGEPSIVYQTVISTMDAARFININGRQEALYPNVLLSADIL